MARANPSEAPFRCSTLEQAPGLTREHQTILERLARDKHSSLLRKSLNYGQKSFITSGPVMELNSHFHIKVLFCRSASFGRKAFCRQTFGIQSQHTDIWPTDIQDESAAIFCCQVSISPIFYEQLFVQKFFAQLFLCLHLGW